jgi:hypothetical protein
MARKFNPNGIFEFNITRLLAYIDSAGRFRAEIMAVDDIAQVGNRTMLNESTILAADLSRPVILAEIAPARFNLIDGHHRVAQARSEGVLSIPAYRILCPEHVAFLTSARAGDAYTQLTGAIETVTAALKSAGAELRHVVRTVICGVDMADAHHVARVHQEKCGSAPPASTLVRGRWPHSSRGADRNRGYRNNSRIICSKCVDSADFDWQTA